MQWHDLLSAVLIDFFDDSPYVVETEMDLSLRKQFLDLVVIRKTAGEFHRTLPDGFAPLANHNLISFKSHQDSFDNWSMLELIGHYVNYRKQTSASLKGLLPEEHFQLFGITSRFPEGLSQQIRLEERQPGVYDISIGALRIRLLVIRDLPDEPVNAMLKLFSIVPTQIAFACQNYRSISPHTTGIVDKLIRKYQKEDEQMATTIADLNRKLMKEAMEMASVKERLRGLTAEQLLKEMPREELLQAMPAEERLKGIPPEVIEAYLRSLREKPSGGR